MKIHSNLVGLKAVKHSEQLTRVISSIIKQKIFLNGKENEKLIRSLTKILGGKYVTLTASGHDALSIALSSLNLSVKDEIIFPVNAYPTAFPIAQSRVKMVPVDVDENGLIDPVQVSKKINKNTKVIVIVHLYGLVANIEQIRRIIKNKKITLIEDCAQTFGIMPKGDIACFSFYPTKNLGALGDGGAIWTKHKKLHNYFTQAVSYGEKQRYASSFISGHSRLPEIQAGVLNLYIKKYKAQNTKLKNTFKTYLGLISKLGLDKFIKVLGKDSFNFFPHLFVIEAAQRNPLQKFLSKQNIPTSIHYPYPIHLVWAFKSLGFKTGDFPVAERLSKNILSLPFHPYLKKNEIKYIVKSIKNFYS